MGAKREAAALPDAFAALIRRVGVKLSLAGEGHDDVTAERLAGQMAAPENAPMRQSNRRAVSDADLLTLARATLNAA